jgi:hypothetical protein
METDIALAHFKAGLANQAERAQNPIQFRRGKLEGKTE